MSAAIIRKEPFFWWLGLYSKVQTVAEKIHVSSSHVVNHDNAAFIVYFVLSFAHTGSTLDYSFQRQRYNQLCSTGL